MRYSVLHHPDPRLRQAAQPVPAVTPAIQALADDLLETMYAEGGIGLAATQVGEPWRVMVMDLGGPEHRSPYVCINPVVRKPKGEQALTEGCLSVPHRQVRVPRAKRVVLQALDRTGRPFTLSAEGLLAACIQHEVDHLDGRLILDAEPAPSVLT